MQERHAGPPFAACRPGGLRRNLAPASPPGGEGKQDPGRRGGAAVHPSAPIRNNYGLKKKSVLALFQRRCQIAAVRFGSNRRRAKGIEDDGGTPERGKSGRSETGGEPREGTQPGCRKPEERPPRHGGCGAGGGHSSRGGLRTHPQPGAGAGQLPRDPQPVAVSSPATGNAAGGPPTRRLHSFARRAAAAESPPLPLAGRGRAIPTCSMQDSCLGALRRAPLPLSVMGVFAGLRLPLPLARKRPPTRPPSQAGEGFVGGNRHRFRSTIVGMRGRSWVQPSTPKIAW